MNQETFLCWLIFINLGRIKSEDFNLLVYVFWWWCRYWDKENKKKVAWRFDMRES